MTEQKEMLTDPAELSAGLWADYYAETDPDERWRIFCYLSGKETDRDLLDFCKQIYKERYHDPAHPDRTVDLYLWKCVYLPGLYKKKGFIRKAFQREMEQTLKELHLSDPGSLTEAEKQCLYMEFRNAARRYLDTCRSDGYGNRFLGLKKASMKQKYEKAGEDIWMMSAGLAHAAGEEERMSLWCDALYEEVCAFNRAAAERYRELDGTR